MRTRTPAHARISSFLELWLEVPTPTLSECSEDGIQDPEEIFPERTGTAGYVREVLSDVFNTCWMSVEKKQNEKGADFDF